MLATLTGHDPHCSGCPACREDYAAMLDETPTRTAKRLTASTARMRHASCATFRVSQPRASTRKTKGEWANELARRVQGYGSVVTDTPDPYATATDKAPYLPCPFDDPNYNPRSTPPDGYAIGLAIEQVRKETR